MAARKNKRKTRGVKGRGRGKKTVQSKFALAKAKPATVKSLAAIAETKKYLGFDALLPGIVGPSYLSITSPYTLMIPASFMAMQSTQNTAAPLFSTVVGRSIFSKYLQMKLEFTYPHGANAPFVPSEPVEVIYGFCEPYNLTDDTNIQENKASRTDLISLVSQQVKADFDESDDPMHFKERKRRSYNIVGRYKITPNKNAQIPTAIPSGSWTVSVAPIQRQVSWKTQKKIRLNKTDDTNDPASSGAVPFIYPNQAYIPFVIIYNKSFANYSANVIDPDPTKSDIKQIGLRHNDCHWFTDM